MVDLRRMRYLMNKIPQQVFRIEQAKSDAMKITQTLSDMPHGSGVHSKVEDGYDRIEQAVDAYEKVLGELGVMRKELEPYIEMLTDPNERAAITLRYMHGMKAREIADMIYKCERQVHRYLQDGEKHMDGINRQ